MAAIPLSNEIPNKRAVNNIVDSSLNKSKPKFGRLSKYFIRFLLIIFLVPTVPMLVLSPLFAGLIFLTGGVFGGFFVPGAIIIFLLFVILSLKMIVFIIKADNRKINQLPGLPRMLVKINQLPGLPRMLVKINQLPGLPRRLVKILLIFFVLFFVLGFYS